MQSPHPGSRPSPTDRRAVAATSRKASAGRRGRRECLAAPERALEEAVQAHGALLRSVARRILGDDDQARDAVQEALVALWQSREEPENLRGWLVQAVVHRSLHARRTRDRRAHWEREAGGLTAGWCPLCDPEHQTEARRRLQAFEEALASLSREHRSVVLLRELEGLEYEEISRRLGIPVGTVRSRLNRARRVLRALAGVDGVEGTV